MPTKPRGYPKHVPKLQFQIIKEIALNGHLSNSKLKERLEVTHPVVSEAIKVLMNRNLVKISDLEFIEHKDGKPQTNYTLTKHGLEEFIKRNPTPKEFFEALLKSHNLRQQASWLRAISRKDFEFYCKLYEKTYLGYITSHGYLVQSPFFNKLYEQWLAEYHPGLFEQNHLKNITRLVHSPFFERCYEELNRMRDLNGITVVQKVLECLAIHRSITEKQIEEFLNSKQKIIEEKLAGKIFKYPAFIQDQIDFHYAITPANIRRVTDRYTLSESYIQDELQKFEDIDYNSIIKKYLEFLSRLVIIRIDSGDEPRYELSLLGVILILAIVTHPHQKLFYIENGQEKNNEDLIKFYSRVSQNYADKLPLIFGKWGLLTNTWHYSYLWFIPVLYQNKEDEFARAIRPGLVSITLGGVKEYQDTMQEIAFHTTARLFELYQGLLSVLNLDDKKYDPGKPLIHNGDQRVGSLALVEKEKELAALLKYADIGKFVDMLKNDKNLTQVDRHIELIYNTELSVIEKALASEITFLFYINLARNKFLDYTDEGRYFLGEERDTGKDTTDFHILKPSDFLRIILKSDKELKNIFLEWMADIRDYRQRSAEQMEEFEKTIRRWNNRQRVS